MVLVPRTEYFLSTPLMMSGLTLKATSIEQTQT